MKKSKQNQIIILITFILITFSCNNTRKNKVIIKINSINNITTVDSFINNRLYSTIEFKDNKPYNYFNYESKILKTNYKNGIFLRVNKLKTNSTLNYSINKKIKNIEKFDDSLNLYYKNTYDTLSGQLLSCYRHLDEEIYIGKNDILTLYLKTNSKNDNVRNYNYILSLLDDEGNVVNTYSTNYTSDSIKLFLKNKKHSWIKTICDSEGCYSINVEFENQK